MSEATEVFLRLAIDAGGTFTDLMIEDRFGHVRSFKSLSTPDDPAKAIFDVLAEAAADLGGTIEALLDQCRILVLGTTIATNALLTGRIARTALITTEGHPDILVLREAGREGLAIFDHSIAYPEPFVPRSLTFEVPERIASDGRVIRPLDEVASRRVLDRIADLEIEAIGVCLLWSFVNPTHEQWLGAQISERLPGLPYTLSHQLNPTLREYRRASSTCLDAALKPLAGQFLADLEGRLRAAGLRGSLLVSTSQGDLINAAAAAASPVHLVMSGPAMAPVAGHHYASIEGAADVAIVIDAGGTSFDVTVVRNGRIPHTQEMWVGEPFLGHMTGFSSVQVHSAAAGGGTIAWLDDGGLLRVGPDSAGADPGPACFGRGGRHPTLTDACLVLGYIDPAFFLGGQMALYIEAARIAVESEIAIPLGLSVETAALAIVRVATEIMAGAIELATTDRGIDPRSAVLVGGGGAAGLNVVAVARRLGCPRIIIPDVGPTLSAAGGLVGDLAGRFAAMGVTSHSAFDASSVLGILNGLGNRARSFAEAIDVSGVGCTIDYAVDARYADQVWEIEVPLSDQRLDRAESRDRLKEDVHRTHEDLFAFRDPASDIEYVTWRAHVACRVRSGVLGRALRREDERSACQPRTAVFAGHGSLAASVLRVSALTPGAPVSGPAIIESVQTSIVIDPGATARITPAGSLLIEL